MVSIRFFHTVLEETFFFPSGNNPTLLLSHIFIFRFNAQFRYTLYFCYFVFWNQGVLPPTSTLPNLCADPTRSQTAPICPVLKGLPDYGRLRDIIMTIGDFSSSCLLSHTPLSQLGNSYNEIFYATYLKNALKKRKEKSTIYSNNK